jgi:hypothetical protein
MHQALGSIPSTKKKKKKGFKNVLWCGGCGIRNFCVTPLMRRGWGWGEGDKRETIFQRQKERKSRGNYKRGDKAA